MVINPTSIDPSLVEYRVSTAKSVLLLVVSVLFVATGIWLVTLGNDLLIAWSCVALFSLCFAASLKLLFDRRPMVTLNSKGFSYRVRSAYRFIPWEDVASSRPLVLRRQQFLVLKLNHPEKYNLGSKMGQSLNKLIGIAEGELAITLTNLPVDATQVIAAIHSIQSKKK